MDLTYGRYALALNILTRMTYSGCSSSLDIFGGTISFDELVKASKYLAHSIDV